MHHLMEQSTYISFLKGTSTLGIVSVYLDALGAESEESASFRFQFGVYFYPTGDDFGELRKEEDLVKDGEPDFHELGDIGLGAAGWDWDPEHILNVR